MAWTAPSGHVYAVGEVVTAATLNTYVGNDLAYLYGDTTWTAPTYANAWVDYGGARMVGGFRLVGTRVVMRGTIKSGTIGVAAFTLPLGYRPSSEVDFSSVSAGAFAWVSVVSTGVVTVQGGSNVSANLDGVNFDTI